MRRIVLPVLILCALSTGALARRATVGSAILELPPPAGFCEADEADPRDRPLFDYMKAAAKPDTRLLSISAECGQLRDWREGRRLFLHDFAQHHTMRAWENAPLPAPPAAVIEQTCATLRSRGGEIVSTIGPDVKERVERALENVRFNEFTFMGVLAQDANACYASLLGRFRLPTGEEISLANVFAITTVKDKAIFYFLCAPFTGAETLGELLARLRGHVAALHAANRN
jgi:hypothetical protein